MSTIGERGNARAVEKAREIEAKRFLNYLQKAKVPEATLDETPQTIGSLVFDGWAKHNGRTVDEIVAYLATEHRRWARMGTFIAIEGGGRRNFVNRDRVMNYCILQAIIANFNSVVIDKESTTVLNEVTRTFLNDITMVVDLISFLPLLSSWEKARFDLLENMSKIPILIIREVDLNRAPREASDASQYIDSVLRSRMLAKMPTILTFMNPTEENELSSAYGEEMTDIISSKYDEKLGIIRIMVNNDGDN